MGIAYIIYNIMVSVNYYLLTCLLLIIAGYVAISQLLMCLHVSVLISHLNKLRSYSYIIKINYS